MRVLLINPSYHNVYANVASAEGFSPPLGLLYIAAYLRREGHEVAVIDANAEQIPPVGIERAIPEGYDVVGTTAFTPSINSSVEVLKAAKNKFPRIVTVIGGAHISVAGKETLEKFPVIDFGVIGEGEETAAELLKHLENGLPVDKISGLVFRKNDTVICNPRRLMIEDLDRIPLPAYDLIPMNNYRIPIHHVGFGRKVPLGPFSLIFTSRGCPMACSFCASKTIWGKKVRYRSAENVLAEIETLHRRFGVRVFDIADDIFTINKTRLHNILDGIIDRGLDIFFNCLSRVDTITEEDLSKMKRAGCYLIRYGVESGSEDILDRMHKHINTEQVVEAFRQTNLAGISCTASFLIGHPGETEETVMKTVQLARRIDANLYHFFIAVPYPGTELFDIARRDNLLYEDTGWEHWKQYPDIGVMRTEALSREDLIRLRNDAYKKVYLNPKFIWKSIMRIRSWGQAVMYAKGAAAVLKLIDRRMTSR
jgi:radical SAM superfamily enzyme YgiQ (UPF0313 family)